MRITTLVTLLAAPLALAACDSGDNTEAMDEMPMADGQMADDQMSMDDGDMAMMGSDGAMQTASAEGTVTAIDAADVAYKLSCGSQAGLLGHHLHLLLTTAHQPKKRAHR